MQSPSLPTTNSSRAKNCGSCSNEIGDVEVVGTAANGLEALDLIEKLDPALAFLDIQMPGLDGLGVVRRLREQRIDPPHIVFSTAFDQFAVEAFRLEAMDYLLKPVERERLEETAGACAARCGRPHHRSRVGRGRRGKPAFTKLLLRSGPRNLIVDPRGTDLRDHRRRRDHAGDGQAEGQSNFRTLEELQAALDPGYVLARAPVLRGEYESHPRSGAVVQIDLSAEMDDKKASEIPSAGCKAARLREMLNL